MLPPDCAPSSIPDDAEEVLEGINEHEEGFPRFTYSCRVNGEIVGQRLRRKDGRLIWEIGWRNDQPNGWERTWEEGRLAFEWFRLDGAEHGVCRQWYKGRLVGWYVMDRGTGLDLYRDDNGFLLAMGYVKSGKKHGFERAWEPPDSSRISSEHHFFEGAEHGIERLWDAEGSLEGGWPRFYVHGERVTKRQYLSAAKNDPTLPPFREEDDRPERPLPPEYFQTMPPAIPPHFDPETGIVTPVRAE
jgi:hypothetical protein